MQRLGDLKRRLASGSDDGGKLTFFSDSIQESLDDIGGDHLAGSGLENEEPESEFDPAGKES